MLFLKEFYKSSSVNPMPVGYKVGVNIVVMVRNSGLKNTFFLPVNLREILETNFWTRKINFSQCILYFYLNNLFI